jgi:alpha-beta hydrolase superfamily lysophospholipase
MKKWWFVVAALAVLAVVAVPRIVRYRRANLETLDLNDAARKRAAGRFLRLPLGYMHYEVAGPAGGRLVVLVPDFSTTYTIWDPTVAGLAEAGFRVLRYDHFGRGSPTGRRQGAIEFFDQEIQDLLAA